MSFGLQLFGAAALRLAMARSIEAALQPQEYWVGSAVPYGPFHEFGTSRITARPHWSLAIPVVAAKYGLSSQQNDLVNMMIETPQGLVIQVAFDLERQVKIEIRAQGVIDTGNYVGAIATGPTEEAAFGKSVAQAIK